MILKSYEEVWKDKGKKQSTLVREVGALKKFTYC